MGGGVKSIGFWPLRLVREALDGAFSVLAWRPGQWLQPGGRWMASEPPSDPLSEQVNSEAGVRNKQAVCAEARASACGGN